MDLNLYYKNLQQKFFADKKSGCLFAAVAANNPKQFGWNFSTSNVELNSINNIITEAIESNWISTQSIIFPTVRLEPELIHLIETLKKSKFIYVINHGMFHGVWCIGIRIQVEGKFSWASGFGNFDFLPKTRRSPFTEITFRSKDRPMYSFMMKKPVEGTLHLADMKIHGLSKKEFTQAWKSSFRSTKNVLGHTPDLRSAAKTTFTIRPYV